MLPIQTIPSTNRLLAALPRKEYQNLLEKCELVNLTFAEVLGNDGEPIQHVYFPTNSVISLVMPIDGGTGLEVGLIGNEGMLGITLTLGVDVAPFRAVVQGEGSALRMTASAFLRLLEKSPDLKHGLKRYLYVLMSQLVQTAGCNRFHVVEERLARLLLMIRDRAHSQKFYITQDLLAKMLGVRRVGVTKAAGSLQKQRLISYSRGHVMIHDIKGLESASCSCYRADKQTYELILDI